MSEQVKNNEQNESKKYVLTITADDVKSTENLFTMNNLRRNKFKPVDVYMLKANREKIRRKDPDISNRTLIRLACEQFEKQIFSLSDKEMEAFPVCQYSPNEEMIRGIYKSEEDYKKSVGKENVDTWKFIVYKCKHTGENFYIHSYEIFSSIIFVKECLKRFGKPGEQFVLVYRDKSKQNDNIVYELGSEDESDEYINEYSSTLIESKNVIFRGAPGTGKTYLARKIAADIVSGGGADVYNDLSDEEKKQVEFVQFHPSYDYTDFVEGLRPKLNDDGKVELARKDGIFKRFADRARKNYKESQMSQKEIEQEVANQDAVDRFLTGEVYDEKFETINGSEFYIEGADEKRIKLYIPHNESKNKITLQISRIRTLLNLEQPVEKPTDIAAIFGTKRNQQEYSYYFVIYNEILKIKKELAKSPVKIEKPRNYVFIIDEINRGEISKIFGELFFAMDPGYRGKAGEVSTQYSNCYDEEDEEEKFYIPENVYIIGTMNDIDRSVDSFDFAMRRRFRFIEIKPEDRIEMLDGLSDALKTETINRMNKLNETIANVDGLNENYQIGPAYFLKVEKLGFDKLWTDYLQPLLHEYIQGMYNEAEIMKDFEKAYNLEGKSDESTQN